MNIIEKIKNKNEIDNAIIYIKNNPENIDILVNTINQEKGVIKYNCEKTLRLISQQYPEIMYPYFDFFVELLENENNFLKWGAIFTISYLTSCDSQNKFNKIFDKYYSFITSKDMIPACNVIKASGVIVKNKPNLKEKIILKILEVDNSQYYKKGELSPECKNIAYGEAIIFFSKIYNDTKNQDLIFEFIKNQTSNSRPTANKLANKFISNLSKE